MKLSKRALAYLRLIGQMEDASVNLTRGYAKAAQELKDAGLAALIPKASGGCWVALTQQGVDYYEEVSDGKVA